jgi:transaldolase
MLSIFIDTPDEKQIRDCLSMNNGDQWDIKGITTNPSLIKKLGINSYTTYIKKMSQMFPEYPISFEVVSDVEEEMIEQAKKIHDLCYNKDNCYVKIPIVNSEGKYNYKAINDTIKAGIKVNVTAIFTEEQVGGLIQYMIDNDSIESADGTILSVFVGRINDAGVAALDVLIPVSEVLYRENVRNKFKILWASSRAVNDIYDAEAYSEDNMYIPDENVCDIITIPPDIFKKFKTLMNKDLNEFSRETSKMFVDDAKSSGLTL